MKPLFVADGMLGSLARKLRILGFDVIYDAQLSDSDIIELARKDQRIILTADHELCNTCSRGGLKAVKLSYSNDLDDMVVMMKNMSVEVGDLRPEESRCPLCNGELREANSHAVPNLPSKITEAHQTVYVCSMCGKAYWPGSHWKRIREFVSRVRQRVNSATMVRSESIGD